MKFITTTQHAPWQIASTTPAATHTNTTLSLTGETDQVWEGFGGCFNELSQKALLQLDEATRNEVYDLLFSKEADGLKFDFCRLPIGASDYAEIWYSHNEVDEDYAMEHFSIARDQKYLLPYIKEALKRNPDMRFFASPWSPPTWMKQPKAYNYGTLVQSERNLNAYALYLALFIEAYAKEGVTIAQLHVQNEPVSNQKFPSCVWTGAEFANFIGNYLAPLFNERGIKTKIWLGTINAPETDARKLTTRVDDYANLVLHDETCYSVVEGVSYQWAGKYALALNRAAFPEKKYIQSENECGDGENTWAYAMYIFEMFHHYITNGVCAYTYWNMVLPPKGESTWGWQQNSMITVTDSITLNPEYYVMKHFSHFVTLGAKRLVLQGHFCGNAVAFQNPDGEIVLICKNPFDKEMSFDFNDERITLPAESISTFAFTAPY